MAIERPLRRTFPIVTQKSYQNLVLYDFTKIYIDPIHLGQVFQDELFANTTPALLSANESENGHLGITYKATLRYPASKSDKDAWRIKIFKKGGIEIQGSPTKWHFGNNADTLNLTSARESFESLAKALNIPFVAMAKGVIQRLDFSTVIHTNYPPKAYYPHLDNLHRFKRFQHPSGNTLYFEQTEKVVTFYDKVLEAKKKNMVLPAWANQLNLLRYEVRYYTPRKTHLFKSKLKWIGDDGKKNLYVGDILTDAIYLDCVDAWEKYYEMIYKTKIATTMITDKNISKKQELINASVAPILAEVGLDALYERINCVALTNPHLTQRQLRTAKNSLKAIIESVPNNHPDVIDELNEKIKLKAQELRDRIYA